MLSIIPWEFLFITIRFCWDSLHNTGALTFINCLHINLYEKIPIFRKSYLLVTTLQKSAYFSNVETYGIIESQKEIKYLFL